MCAMDSQGIDLIECIQKNRITGNVYDGTIRNLKAAICEKKSQL